MIQHISIKNFKCFEELRLCLSNLTLITGINGTGKSTITQALLLLRQSNDDKKIDIHNQVKIDGDLVDLIDANSIRYAFNDERDISITLTDNEAEYSFLIKNAIDDKKEATCEPSANIDTALETCSLFSDDFIYLYADRTPPQRNYIKESNSSTDSRIGNKHGNRTAFRFYQAIAEGEILPISALKRPETDNTVKNNVSAWINYIMDSSFQVSATQESTEQIRIDYTTQIKGLDITSSPLNVAFGNSYILPIILAILTAPVGSLIIIENPEAHLHPSAQFRMGQLLSIAAENGIQLIIETHSDHLLNGIRVSTKNNEIQTDHIEIYYIEQDNENPTIHKNTRIQLEEDGKLNEWPNGFFDEWENALRLINE